MAKVKPVTEAPPVDEEVTQAQNPETPETEVEVQETPISESEEKVVHGGLDSTEEGKEPDDFPEEESDLDEIGAAVGIDPNDMTKEEKDLLRHIYQKRRVHSASKKEKVELYKNEKIVSTGEKVKTIKDKRKEEYNLLMIAARSIKDSSSEKRLLYGTVDGMYEDENTGMWHMTASVDDTDGQFVIRIPATAFFELNPDDYKNDKDGLKHLRSELSSRIGSHIAFAVYDVNEKEGYAYGSRIDAMEQIARNYYVKKKSDGIPEIVNGCRVKAEVVSTAKDRLKVDVMGAEATILSKELSHVALGPINEEFHIGDTFLVNVDKIEDVIYESMGKKHHMIHLVASKRAAEPDPSTLYFDQFNVGDRCYGEIKNITEFGVFVRLKKKMDCVCHIPVTGMPAIGKTCIVDIYNKDENNRWLYGNIVHIN